MKRRHVAMVAMLGFFTFCAIMPGRGATVLRSFKPTALDVGDEDHQSAKLHCNNHPVSRISDCSPSHFLELRRSRSSSERATGNARQDGIKRKLIGSSPPKCEKRCGRCSPCKSVIVPIHIPASPSTTIDYYPEAWRCKCGGRIYLP